MADRRPIDELAMEYVLRDPQDPEYSWQGHVLFEEMVRRIGQENTWGLLAKTYEILKIVGL